MGKRLLQQRAGRGSPAFRRPSHRFKSNAKYRNYDDAEKSGSVSGEIVDFVDDPSRSALLMDVRFDNSERKMLIAPEGARLGAKFMAGATAPIEVGNVLPLSALPDGAPIYNIELIPGDGGKLVRTAGCSGFVVSHDEKGVIVRLPSKQIMMLSPACRAQVGVICGGGRLEKPMLKAGNSHYKWHATNRRWPNVRGVKMCAYQHPFGGKQHHKGKSSCTSRGAPPGRKVGHIAARSVGRKKTHVEAAKAAEKNVL